ncbi:hypothetical protein HYQ46_008953 [Verticillium longisporum]|nr:hypothetical protein HYQ46_008953 [Verticillium longisporum]
MSPFFNDTGNHGVFSMRRVISTNPRSCTNEEAKIKDRTYRWRRFGRVRTSLGRICFSVTDVMSCLF